jgi:hypothetical protein
MARLSASPDAGGVPHPARLDAVRAAVRRFLEGSRAFDTLAPEHRAKFAGDMVKVVDALAADGLLEAASPPLAKALGDAADDTKTRLSKDAGAVGKGFVAGAIREGTKAFRDMVDSVDFPKFVGGLIQNVFQAIVDASIQQMQAFGELLAAAAKSVDQFASDHITDAQARDHIANRYPGAVEIVAGEDGTARLGPGPRGDQVNVGSAFGVSGVDFSDEESERTLVNAAKLQMARQQQQQLSVMVLMGINRIVVTDGHINAKVVFDMRASDEAKRHAKAEMLDKQADSASASSGTGWATNLVGGYSAGAAHDHQTTVSSAVDDTIESKAAAKAQLSGDVRIAFKSETFPLERMVDLMGRDLLTQKAAPSGIAGRPLPPVAPPAAPAAGATR